MGREQLGSTSISKKMFVIGLLIAVLSSIVASVAVSSLLSLGPTGLKGDTGATGPQGPYTPDYDSGWINITDKNGQYYTLTHNLGNTTNVIVDITGKTSADGPVHDWYLGLSRVYSNGFNTTYHSNAGGSSAVGLIQTSDGGYALIGYVSNVTTYEPEDMYVVKVDANGQLQWSKILGGAKLEMGWSIVQASDGGYLALGYSASYSVAGDEDLYIAKLGANGNLLWNKTFGGPDNEEAGQVIRTSDGGYLLLSLVNSPIDHSVISTFIVKIDANGNAQWSKTYAAASFGAGSCLLQVNDGYLVGGYSTVANNSEDFLLFKISSTGTMLWNKTYSGPLNESIVDLISPTSDGGYVIAGASGHLGTYFEKNDLLFMVKTDANGNMQWNKTLHTETGNDTTVYQFGRGAIQTLDGGYAFAGFYLTLETPSGESAFDAQAVLIKTDAQGNLQWTRTFGEAGRAFTYRVIQTRDGSFIMCGFKSNGETADMCLIKTAVNGEFGLAWASLTANTITLYRGDSDPYWNYVRVRIWVIK